MAKLFSGVLLKNLCTASAFFTDPFFPSTDLSRLSAAREARPGVSIQNQEFITNDMV